MRIVLFNRFFFPDPSATSQIASDLAFVLAANGHEVHVVTSGTPTLANVEVVEGVTVHRVGRATKTSSLARKAFDYLRYYVGARSAAKRILEPGDIALVKTDPPMLAAAIGPIAKRRGAILVSWLQDVFPEIAMAYGIPGAGLPPIRMLRDRWVRRSDHCVAIGDAMKARIVAAAQVPASRVSVIHNWARGEEITPLEPGASSLREEWSLRGKFVVGYSGNLGRVHEFETILGAAALLADRPEIAFVVIGSGPQLDDVKAAVEARRISNIQFRPLQARASLADSLGLPDVHLCVLRPEFEALVVPSKIYGILAAGRPQVYIGDREGEMAHLLESERAGVAVAIGDAKALSDAIRRFQSDAELRIEMGRNARALFDREFDFPIAMRRWGDLLAELRVKHNSPA